MKYIFLMLIFIIPTALLAQSLRTDNIQKIIDRSIDQKQIFGITLSLSYKNESHHFAAGNRQTGDPYFIASITKLYTAAVLFALVDQDKVALDDPINEYLPSSVLGGLHVYNGKEYSNDITVRHLVTNTSGISDYFMQQENGEKSLFDHLKTVGDTTLAFDQMIDMTKELPSVFPPGAADRAFYSDTNFQLLGKVIEKVTGQSIEESYESFIFEPLDLQQTYLYKDAFDTTPAQFYHKKDVLHIPKMMSSFRADGGLVATSEENLKFLKAFINHRLFSEKHVSLNTGWNKIFAPFQYGYGMMKFKFFGMPEMIGHAGANGSFAYYIPSKQVYITGSINQTDKQQQVYKLIGKILRTINN